MGRIDVRVEVLAYEHDKTPHTDKLMIRARKKKRLQNLIDNYLEL